ncbi:MAG TPA: trypsin-like peptidase domain-containing protein [Telluria sp.]|nr:trypsin-like peptidase domain-containing protein [Telluria sp.]
MMTLIRFAAALVLCAASLAARAADPTNAPTPALPTLENSVVKVFSTLRRPDLYKPWSKQAPADVTGSGVVVEGHRILTNAHVVQYASQVQVQANQSGDKLDAKVVAIAPGIDLALLELDDEAFFATHAAVPRSSALPDVREAVFAYGYPAGGTSLSITKGIVSRIEFVGYSYAISGLRIQVDAALNPGNSGGPAIANDKMIGLAFSMVASAQNIGYIIPNEEIELFLKDVRDGHYDGKPNFLEQTQTIENPALRDFLKLDKKVEGAIVTRPYSDDPAYPLKEWDVITRIGDWPIDNEGDVHVGPNLRVNFRYRVQQLAKDGKVPLTVVRNGKVLTVSAPVYPRRPAMLPPLNGGYPDYFIYGPVVFTRATAEFLGGWAQNGAGMLGMSAAANPMVTQLTRMPSAERQELVVVAAPFFPDKTVKGYDSRLGSVLDSVNGVPVKSLKHLVSLLRDLKDDLVVLRFDQLFAETVVLRRKDVLAATDTILADNGIRFQGTPELMDIWSGRTR